jgi:hypothetical protein
MVRACPVEDQRICTLVVLQKCLKLKLLVKFSVFNPSIKFVPAHFPRTSLNANSYYKSLPTSHLFLFIFISSTGIVLNSEN